MEVNHQEVLVKVQVDLVQRQVELVQGEVDLVQEDKVKALEEEAQQGLSNHQILGNQLDPKTMEGLAKLLGALVNRVVLDKILAQLQGLDQCLGALHHL